MAKSIDISPILRKLKKLQQYSEEDAMRIAGTEAVKYFQGAFVKGAWEGRRWPESKRRDKGSVWYGFEKGARVVPPARHPRRKGTKRKYKPRKSNPITNFSPAATKRRTLIGFTGDLRESITYRISGHRVVVYSNLPYSTVHNDGGYTKVFGKKRVRMPQRQFMGLSPKLRQIIQRELHRGLDDVLR